MFKGPRDTTTSCTDYFYIRVVRDLPTGHVYYARSSITTSPGNCPKVALPMAHDVRRKNTQESMFVQEDAKGLCVGMKVGQSGVKYL